MKKTTIAILIAMSAGAVKAECVGAAHLCGGDTTAMQMSRIAQASQNYALIMSRESKLNRKQEDRKHDALKRVASGWRSVNRGARRVDRNTRIVQDIENNQAKRGVQIPVYQVAFYDMQYKEYKTPMKYKSAESDWVEVADGNYDY